MPAETVNFQHRAQYLSSTARIISRRYSDIYRLSQKPRILQKSARINDLEQVVIKPSRGHTGQSATGKKTDGAVHYRGEEGRSLIWLAGETALPAQVIFQSSIPVAPSPTARLVVLKISSKSCHNAATNTEVPYTRFCIATLMGD
jgi:hypothetical protein